MPGWGLRAASDAGLVTFAPVRMSAVPALLPGPWGPDLLVGTVVGGGGGFPFGSEVSWQRAAIAAGAIVAAVVSYGAPHADAGSPLPAGQVMVVGETREPPGAMRAAAAAPAHQAIARLIAPLIAPGARLQVGPSPVASALLGELTVPVRLGSGLLYEGVADLDLSGTLGSEPVSA